MIDEAIDFIVRLPSDTYESLHYQMPVKQRDVSLAIASERNAREISGSRFVKKYVFYLPAAYLLPSRGFWTRISSPMTLVPIPSMTNSSCCGSKAAVCCAGEVRQRVGANNVCLQKSKKCHKFRKALHSHRKPELLHILAIV